MKVLGIETSCDETSAAVIETRGVEERKILSNIVATQIEFHQPYGGVVPEIASRQHIESIAHVVAKALDEAGTTLNAIDGIAATYTPGLLGALLVGLQYGKSLAFALKKPFIGVHHLEGHIHSVGLEEEVTFPYLGLIVSGGHTHLYLVKGLGEYQCLGATRDDACGEAFDKVAKLLNLGYPGGPEIQKTAVNGNINAFSFTRPKLGEASFDFSYSGIKTACLLKVKEQNGNLSPNFIRDLAASFQEAATGFLIERIEKSVKQHKIKTIAVVGGVAANRCLREKLKKMEGNIVDRCHIPPISLCTDNAAMIAYVGAQYLAKGVTSPLSLNAVATKNLC